MSQHVRYETSHDVAVITIDNPPVNVLQSGIPEALSAGIEQANQDETLQAIVIIGAGRTFVAGADIKELARVVAGTAELSGALPALLTVAENSPKPVVAAIHGSCLGGGMELALACHYRVATSDAQLGQPEVKIGLIPGAHGTQRLPRLCGIAKAAEMCATGNMVSATDAASCGIVDHVVSDNLLEETLTYVRETVIAAGPRKTSELVPGLTIDDETQQALDILAKTVRRQARGQTAPLVAIEAVQWAATLPFAEGVERERTVFHECVNSGQAAGLIHAFFGQRTVKKIPGISVETPRRDINQAAVVGAGTMGGGITMAYVNAGIPVTLKEIDQDRLDAGMARITSNYQRSVDRGRLTDEKLQQRMELITPTLDYADLSDADIIVEAVFESLELKKQVFAEIDTIARPGAILASNTSTLDLDQIAGATGRPQDVIGHHFFSPANVMKLLEIVRGKETADDVIATSMELAARLRKVGVLVGNCFGFLGNRMFMPYLAEAEFLVEEGADISRVDKLLYDFGMAMGPFAVADLAGIDVGWRIEQEVKGSLPEGMRRPLLTTRLYELGRYGQKTSAGWYRYEDGRTPLPDAAVDTLRDETAAAAEIERRDFDDQEILDRIVYTLVNEGARLLQEGIALRSVDIDIAYLNGYGFPAWRGGPMKYADMVGLANVYERVKEFHEVHGFWWEPAPLLAELAQAGSTFSEYDQRQS